MGTLFTTMLDQQEMDMFTYCSIDPLTFEPVKLDGDKLRKFQNAMLRYYKKDLKQAYEFIAARKSVDRVEAIKTLYNVA
jgi:hypothetical protein